MKHDDTANGISIRAAESLFLIETINNEHEQRIPFPVITECNGIMKNNIKLSYCGIIIICDSYGYYDCMNTVIHERHAAPIDVIAFIRRNVR